MISSTTGRRFFARVSLLATLIVAAWPVAPASADAPMITGGLTSQPIGHYEFCKENPAECRIRIRDVGPLQLTDAIWNTIETVNAAVNAAVKPMNDVDIYGKDEVWTYPQGVGDCEDYVLEKRRELMNAGISLADLLITVVRKPDGEGHAVLMVRTDRGDLVLDNQIGEILVWKDTSYQFVKRQSQTDSRKWVGIDDTRIVTASVRR